MLWMIPCDSSQNHSWFIRKLEIMTPFQSISQGVGWKPKVKVWFSGSMFLVSRNFGSNGLCDLSLRPRKPDHLPTCKFKDRLGVTSKESGYHPSERNLLVLPTSKSWNQVDNKHESINYLCLYVHLCVLSHDGYGYFYTKGIEREGVSV